MEKICTVACVLVGTIFLIVALFGAWRHLITMTVCYAAAVMISDEKPQD
ncbi:MAG: hypothetical protein IJZ70_01310 [Bacteroidales bacterium]|nr:hypothetical protein [Bacteroidales bacterium]